MWHPSCCSCYYKPSNKSNSVGHMILLNCCNLTSDEYNTIQNLRQLKNNFLSHNTEGAITADEFKSVWTDLTAYVLQLDNTKEDNLIRIKSRPLDEALCHKYNAILLDIHQKLDEIGASIQGVDETIQRIDTTTNEIDRRVQRIDQTITGTNTAVMGIQATMEELLYYAKRGITCQCSTDKCQQQVKKFKESIQPYKLGQSFFTLHHQIVLTSVVIGGDSGREVSDILMMDDGRLVVFLPNQRRLVICNTDGSQVDSIDVQGRPWRVTAVNNSTVAVTLFGSKCIEMFDINNKLKLKSIPIPDMWWWCWSGITTINNKLVAGDVNKLLIIDHQTGEVVQTIQTDCCPDRLHGSGDRIFYCDIDFYNNNKLYWYSYTDDRHHTLTLPSPPRRMTTLQDGSLYVMCQDGSVQHVSSDCKQYKPVKTFQTTSARIGVIHYNLTQRKLVIIQGGLVTVFNEL